MTGPLLLPLFGGSWQDALAFWSLPVAGAAVAVLLLTQHDSPRGDEPPVRWWPDWRDGRTWILGLTLGGASTSYWGANAFLPDFLRLHQHAAFITPALTALNLVQLPASLAVAALPRYFIARIWPLSMAGAITILTTTGIIILPPVWLVADAGLLGFSTALVFVLTLALPPLIAEPGDTHRISAAVFTISYLCPFLGSLVGGALWDLTKVPQAAFTPLFAGGILMLLLPFGLDLTSAWMRRQDMSSGQAPAIP